jgi:hypothetical protein
MKRVLPVLLLVFMLSGVSFADLGLKSIAPQVGLIFPKSPFSTGFEIGAIANMGEFSPGFGLFPFITYWHAGGSEFGTDVSFSNFQIGGDVQYYFKEAPGLFAGAGLSLNFESVSTEFSDPFLGTYSGSASETNIGFGILAGYEMPIDKYKGFVKAKYNLISDANTFELVVGLYFNTN